MALFVLKNLLDQAMTIFDSDKQWLREELGAIRAGIAQNSTELAAIKTELRSIHSEQDRFEMKLEKHDEVLRDMRDKLSGTADLDKRLAKIEHDVSDLKTWKTEKKASWNGPNMVIAAIASLTPILGALWIVIQVFSR